MPSTRHLTTASLYWSRPSPCFLLLKQSIIKEQLLAITLSDPNGISSGTLKPAIFFCNQHGWAPWDSGWVWMKCFIYWQISCLLPLSFQLLFVVRLLWCFSSVSSFFFCHSSVVSQDFLTSKQHVSNWPSVSVHDARHKLGPSKISLHLTVFFKNHLFSIWFQKPYRFHPKISTVFDSNFSKIC